MNTFPTTSPDAANRPRACIFRTDHLEIDLGEFPWALMYPAYGYNGVVEGVIKFSKKCTRVTQITVKVRPHLPTHRGSLSNACLQLEGVIATTTSDYVNVAIPGVSRTILVSQTVSLLSHPDAEDSSNVSAGTQYRFSLPFPSHIIGQDSFALPPSYTAIHPGAATEVKYHVEVSVSRKGFFRRREV